MPTFLSSEFKTEHCVTLVNIGHISRANKSAFDKLQLCKLRMSCILYLFGVLKDKDQTKKSPKGTLFVLPSE